MERIKVGASDVASMLRAVVAERPDYIYEPPTVRPDPMTACYYVHGEAPGCLIGHVLNRLGVPLPELARWEGQSADDVANETLNITGHPDAVAKVLTELSWAQNFQDGGRSWGDALADATRKPGE